MTLRASSGPSHDTSVVIQSGPNQRAMVKLTDPGDGQKGSAFWIFNLVANLAYSRYDLISPEVQSKVIQVEQQHFQALKEQDQKVSMALSEAGGAVKALKMMTEFSNHIGNFMLLQNQNVLVNTMKRVVSPLNLMLCDRA